MNSVDIQIDSAVSLKDCQIYLMILRYLWVVLVVCLKKILILPDYRKIPSLPARNSQLETETCLLWCLFSIKKEVALNKKILVWEGFEPSSLRTVLEQLLKESHCQQFPQREFFLFFFLFFLVFGNELT